jgi:hypothetical protein
MPTIEPMPSRTKERVVDLAPLEPGREITELWLALSRRAWRSVVLLPADRRDSTRAAATALAEVGRRLRLARVDAVVADELGYDQAAALIRSLATHGATAGSSDQVVLAIPSVVLEPLGVAVARQADLVVLCIRMGWSGLDDARRTVELVGEDRLAGCLVLR